MKATAPIIASALVGIVYGGLAGGAFGTCIVPFYGTLYGLFWGALAGFVGGTVAGVLGPRYFGIGGAVGGLATVAVTWSLSLYDRPASRILWIAPPVVISLLLGFRLSSELVSDAEPYLPLAGWLRRLFARPGFQRTSLGVRMVIGSVILGSALLAEWARQHFKVILW